MKMKRILISFAFAMIALVSNAQIVSSQSSRITRTHTERTPIIFLDLGAGGFTGDGDDFGIDLGLRATKMFHPNVGWDILKVSAQTSVDDFIDALNIQAKTGVRGVSPVLFGSAGTIYANFALGYGYYTDIEEGGVAWELGCGVNFNKHISLGIAYNRCDYSYEYSYYSSRYWHSEDVDVKLGLFSVRLSIGF